MKNNVIKRYHFRITFCLSILKPKILSFHSFIASYNIKIDDSDYRYQIKIIHINEIELIIIIMRENNYFINNKVTV